ncbi:hypothetical protein J2Z32_003757 [Paenibacillus turicensis]|uniref:Uncharacterized protein n=1 Tax=Paenibacillus turicensis TaxID=160487 RepID=A0ABS4FX04_9BACL|nr:hypothetical protein [Paenibacillus turicensis]MBP1907092.1 hypothetical protein [Paenibacillus turicensis]
MSNDIVDFGEFTSDVYSGNLTVNKARECLNKQALMIKNDKQYSYILVIAKDWRQAAFLWGYVRDKYPKDARVRFVSRNEYMLDGLCAWRMAIVFLGEYETNLMASHPRIKGFINLGADVFYEEVDKC